MDSPSLAVAGDVRPRGRPPRATPSGSAAMSTSSSTSSTRMALAPSLASPTSAAMKRAAGAAVDLQQQRTVRRGARRLHRSRQFGGGAHRAAAGLQDHVARAARPFRAASLVGSTDVTTRPLSLARQLVARAVFRRQRTHRDAERALRDAGAPGVARGVGVAFGVGVLLAASVCSDGRSPRRMFSVAALAVAQDFDARGVADRASRRRVASGRGCLRCGCRRR